MPLRQLERLVGHEVPLEVLHGELRRGIQAVRDVVEYGTMLVTCSDEFNGELRRNFDRDVARTLLPHVPNRTFSVANMAGRVEPAAIQLADAHFTVRTREEGAKLLLVEIAAHVGRRMVDQQVTYGELSRFGLPSPCCGALTQLIDPPPAAGAVRHPWFEQLTAFFGPHRLGALRADAGPHRMVSAAIVHAVLQAESALADVLRDPPRTPTHVVIVPLVIVNQRGSDGALLVGCHHLVCDGREVHVERGGSLRSTPGAHRFEGEGGPLVVTSPWSPDEELLQPILTAEQAAPASTAEALERLDEPAVQARLEHTRAQVERLAPHPNAARVYARPLLRGLLQALSVVAPEVGLGLLLAEGATELVRAQRLHEVLARGPTTEEARRALHDLEPRIQQLGHRDAQAVLEALLARQRARG